MNIGRNWRLKADENDNLVIYHKDPLKKKWKAVSQFRPPLTHRIKKKKLDKEVKKKQINNKNVNNLNNVKLNNVKIEN